MMLYAAHLPVSSQFSVLFPSWQPSILSRGPEAAEEAAAEAAAEEEELPLGCI